MINRKRGLYDRKGQMNMSFGWIFAIIVGAVILFLTIFGITKFMNTAETQQQSAASEDLSTLLNPLESSFESATSTFIDRNVETRISNNCYSGGEFGEQGLVVAEESVGGWADTGLESRTENRYVFSKGQVQGKRFWFFTKPFEYPFKVADLIYLTSGDERYCFTDPPEGVEDEVSDLNQNNLAPNCTSWSGDYNEVCFSEEGNCDVSVEHSRQEGTSSGKVKKNGEELFFYSDALMYAAIFSDKELYECQVARLAKRTRKLSDLYSKKDSYVDLNDCGSNLAGSLSGISSSLGDGIQNYESDGSDEISGHIKDSGEFQVTSIKQQNEGSLCRLW